MSATVLILPGWQGSGPEHWQMHWVRRHGYAVVEQNDWQRPRRGDWLARLDETVVRARLKLRHSFSPGLIAELSQMGQVVE